MQSYWMTTLSAAPATVIVAARAASKRVGRSSFFFMRLGSLEGEVEDQVVTFLDEFVRTGFRPAFPPVVFGDQVELLGDPVDQAGHDLGFPGARALVVHPAPVDPQVQPLADLPAGADQRIGRVVVAQAGEGVEGVVSLAGLAEDLDVGD